MENKQKEQTYYHGAESIRRQIAFALGGAPMNLCWVIVSSYLMFFLTDVAMVPMVAVSTLFLAVRAFDADQPCQPLWRLRQPDEFADQRIRVPFDVHVKRQFHPLVRLVPGLPLPAGGAGAGL